MSVAHDKRRRRVRQAIREHDLDALLVTNETNVTWLTGFTGDSTYLLTSPAGDHLLSDSRYTTQLEEECPRIPAVVRNTSQSMADLLAKIVKKTDLKRIGVEGQALTIEAFHRLQNAVSSIEFVPLSSPIEHLRAVKDAGEIKEIREAVALAARGLDFLKATLTPQTTEREAAFELEHTLRRLGANGVSFPPIIAVGDRAALPHYRPGAHHISEASLLLVDWGAETQSGYKSDLTRTFCTGKVTRKFERIYSVVLEAQERAIEAIRPGATCREIDAIAREHIRAAGFGRRFGHGLGHGIGLNIHEQPRLSPISQDVLEPGMVVTVEPGIYVPGWGGVRIEDDVLVTDQGCEVLSAAVPKDITSIHLPVQTM